MPNVVPLVESDRTLALDNKAVLESIYKNDSYLDKLINTPRKKAEEAFAKSDPAEFIKQDDQRNLVRAELLLKSLKIIIPYGLGSLLVIVLAGNSVLTLRDSSATALDKSQAQSILTSVTVGALAFIFGKHNSDEGKNKSG
jgi:hypothetical protein